MKGNILIVDDQIGIRLLLNEILQKEGYQIFQAGNGQQALAAAEKEKMDLVLLDMRIPGMNGIEILEKLKEMDEKIKVVMMTAYGEKNMMDAAKELGALAHFAKPFDIEEVRQMVRSYIPEQIKTQ